MTFIEAVRALHDGRKQGLKLMCKRDQPSFRTHRELTLDRYIVMVNGAAPTIADVLSEDWR